MFGHLLPNFYECWWDNMILGMIYRLEVVYDTRTLFKLLLINIERETDREIEEERQRKKSTNESYLAYGLDPDQCF